MHFNPFTPGDWIISPTDKRAKRQNFPPSDRQASTPSNTSCVTTKASPHLSMHHLVAGVMWKGVAKTFKRQKKLGAENWRPAHDGVPNREHSFRLLCSSSGRPNECVVILFTRLSYIYLFCSFEFVAGLHMRLLSRDSLHSFLACTTALIPSDKNAHSCADWSHVSHDLYHIFTKWEFG